MAFCLSSQKPFLDGPHFELSRACRHDRLDQDRAGGGGDRGRDLRDYGRLVELGLPRLVFSPEAPIHVRIEALEQFNRDTRLLVLDRPWWSANPLGMLWPEMDAAFVTSGEETRARRPECGARYP